jgi:hypothetical protein
MPLWSGGDRPVLRKIAAGLSFLLIGAGVGALVYGGLGFKSHTILWDESARMDAAVGAMLLVIGLLMLRASR